MTIFIFRLTRVRSGASADTIATDVCSFFGMERPIWSTLCPLTSVLVFHTRFDSVVVPDLVELSRCCDRVPFDCIPVNDALVDLDLVMDEVSAVYHPCMYLVGVVLRYKDQAVDSFVVRRRLPEFSPSGESSSCW